MKDRLLIITATTITLIVVLTAGCSWSLTGNQQSDTDTQSATKTTTYLSFSASPAVLNLEYGTILKFGGRLRGRGESGLADETVLIQRKEGYEWSTIFTLTTNKNGYYTKKHTPSAGTYYYRAKYEGDSDYRSCESHEQKSIVK